MAAKKKKAATTARRYQRLGDQLSIRVHESVRERLAERMRVEGLRSIGEAARQVLEQHA